MLTTETRAPPISSRDAAIEILGRHHGDPAAGGMGRKGGAEGNGENRRQPDKCFHLKALASLLGEM